MDIAWLQNEARSIHGIFEGLFYPFVTVLLLLGVVVDYFKVSIGGVPGTVQLVGRAFVAALLLHAYPEITNALASVADALAAKVGDLSQIKKVLDATGDRLDDFSWSWTSAKGLMLTGISFITFFLFYLSVYIANAGVVYVWVLAYVFSPLLIALYVLPATAGATKMLFQSIFEVSAWKVVWSTMAALLWSTALVDISKTGDDISALTLVSYNLMLAVSLLLTPIVVKALISGGLTSVVGSMVGMAAGAAALNPGALAPKLMKAGVRKSAGFAGTQVARGFNFIKDRVSDGISNLKPTSVKKKTPPKWHSEIPPPTEPPLFLKNRLAREGASRNKDAKK